MPADNDFGHAFLGFKGTRTSRPPHSNTIDATDENAKRQQILKSAALYNGQNFEVR
ncbi:hypothetical protein DOTSEDRAFT_75297 [Dothistroma septosporum NZE10]|uniref:Uncharacterized protein n=1 Tax=Dothistroma septosporum (strain NZE10 / CBS 128990) TaxID=675120 RepID=M2YKV2_DOTSN|nr:hypothetical protein DOTSEDRAFT_75297 [Dothistroma septosporum NZE10]